MKFDPNKPLGTVGIIVLTIVFMTVLIVAIKYGWIGME